MSEQSDLQRRRARFEQDVERIEAGVTLFRKEGVSYTCPCCGYPTLEERGGYEICEICGWEEDGQDDPGADEIRGGPNGDYSLTEARANFEAHLTMYRKRDTQRFTRDTLPARMQKKRKLIEEFEATHRDQA